MAIPNNYRQSGTNQNRRRTLKDRMKRVIDNSDIPGSEKLFIKQQIMSIMQEYAELWECRSAEKEGASWN